MPQLNWRQIQERYSSNPNSHTKNGKPFRVWRITDDALFIALPSGEQSVNRVNLEKAARLIEQGAEIRGPADYKSLVVDERPAYAWAILRDMGIIEE